MVNLDPEQALLASVLQGYRDLTGLARTVTADDFGNAQHANVWDAALAVHTTGAQPDAHLVAAHLGSLALRLPGGPAYLLDLAGDPTVITVNAPAYAAQVHRGAVLRQIANLGARCQQLLTDPDADPDDMLAKITRWADQITLGRPTTATTPAQALERVVDVAEHGEPASLPTPWRDLTELLGGWYPGQLVVAAARPGVGKSLVLENAATHAAQTGAWVCFVTLEMTATELVQRTTAHMARVELSYLRKAGLSDADWQRLNDTSPEIAALPVRYYDDGDQSVADIRAHAWETRQEARRNGADLGLVVVDYLQLIRTRRDQSTSRQQQLGEVSRALKRLAKELQVPVLTAAQLNRQSTQRANSTPMLADIREAGDIEQDADVVLLAHEEEYEDGGRMMKTGTFDLIVAKHRNGPQRTISLSKHGHYARIAS